MIAGGDDDVATTAAAAPPSQQQILRPVLLPRKVWAVGYKVPFSMQFQQDGKYKGWCSVTAVSIGQEGRLLFIKDDVSGRHFLCDMDAEERFACIAGGHADKWARPPS